MIRKYGLIFLLAGITFNCAKKTVPTAVIEDYSEDLTHTMPEIEKYEDPALEVDETAEKAPFRHPDLDVTEDLDVVLDSIAAINKNLPYLRYTVMVHNSNSRNDAEEARKDVFRVLPEAKPKLQFNSPSYIVKVGDFIDQLEAYQTLIKLKRQFPNAVIIPEQVYIDE
jgi:hypothetical protein